MQGRVVVHLTSGELIWGQVHEMDEESVKAQVDTFIQAEGQGSFVLDCGEFGWCCIPTRSIDFISIRRHHSMDQEIREAMGI